MPRVRVTSVGELLQESPLLNTEKLEKIFPSEDDKNRLVKLSERIDDAIDKNETAEQTWQTIGNFKDITIKLLGTAFKG